MNREFYPSILQNKNIYSKPVYRIIKIDVLFLFGYVIAYQCKLS